MNVTDEKTNVKSISSSDYYIILQIHSLHLQNLNEAKDYNEFH